jgi:predicted metal-dependent phosphoesterase TrpH
MPRHRIETHAHTSTVSPCGHLSPGELVGAYAAEGYSALVITDHFVPWLPVLHGADSWSQTVSRFYSGYRAAEEAADGSGLTVLPGFEVTLHDLPGRDFLVYGLDERALLQIPDPWAMPFATFKQAAESAGALVFQAHPFRYSTPIDPGLLDGVEVYNGNPRHDSQNHLAASFADTHDLLRISGSDAHQWPDIGRGGIVMPEVPSTIAEFVQLYRDLADEIELLTLTGVPRTR